MLEEGKKAPLFTLKNQDGENVSLNDLKGKKIVLYFYPKDDTPGCTKEACNFRDEFPKFSGLDVVILGISPDSVESHKKFSSKYKLPFDLLSDENKEAVEKYGVWKEKNNYGKIYMGVERTTFVLDENLIVKKIFRKVKVDGHNEEIKHSLAS
ncbi:MAG: thioredoxin-dependent thiol peroxidase [Ignavibacteriaceae bacterium]|nr:thioredoxin-dependent thiol peroxidase [Ignavibacteriaceae bacterium]